MAIFGDAQKLSTFLGAMLLALIACCIVGGIFPAIGPLSLLNESDIAALHWRIDGATPIVEYIRLREGGFSSLNLNQLVGIISFPSFHAATALIVTHAWQSSRFFVPVCILNVLMTIATWTQGGHYFMDTIAGLVVAALAVRIMQMRTTGAKAACES